MQALHPTAVGAVHTTRFTEGLTTLAAGADLATPVPTCGGWNLADLTWHLAEVQHFWAYMIANRPNDYSSYDRPVRPADTDVVAFLRGCHTDLTASLDGVDAEEPAWSWHEPDQSVGFTIRRQTQEALVHYYDAVLALGATPLKVEPETASDGVDEILRIMLSGSPDGFAAETEPIAIHATDATDTWTVVIGTGGSAEEKDEAEGGPTKTLKVLDGSTADERATVSARAVDLNLWLWGRSDDSNITCTGDAETVSAFRGFVATAEV